MSYTINMIYGHPVVYILTSIRVEKPTSNIISNQTGFQKLKSKIRNHRRYHVNEKEKKNKNGPFPVIV